MKRLNIILIAAAAFAATPAEIAIQRAEKEIAKTPNHAPYYNALAMAYARRARETSDVKYYTKAEETLAHSFELDPGNYDGLKTQAWLELGKHEFAKALETATKSNRKTPDDVMVYGYLVDANVELGNYKAAVAAAQWMLDLSAGNVAGLTRSAYLRELHGNIPGAIELMHMAYDSTSSAETEDRAWLLTQMAHLNYVAGDLGKAEMYASGALGVFANYHYALGTLAQIRIAQKRYEEAVALLRTRYDAAPHAENLYALAEALELAGHTDESRKAFEEFENKSLGETGLSDNSNHELIAYYVDHAHRPEAALEVARREIKRRQDVFTIDCYAWALAANGDYALANSEIQKAVELGLKDPKILSHRDFIARHLNQTEKAE